MIFVDIPADRMPAEDFAPALRREGVVINPARGGRARFVTHRDVDAAAIRTAGERIARALEAAIPADA
jgi:threonine aldolase